MVSGTQRLDHPLLLIGRQLDGAWQADTGCMESFGNRHGFRPGIITIRGEPGQGHPDGPAGDALFIQRFYHRFRLSVKPHRVHPEGAAGVKGLWVALPDGGSGRQGLVFSGTISSRERQSRCGALRPLTGPYFKMHG